MHRVPELKPRESKPLPMEKLRDILSKIYPPEIVEDLIAKFTEQPRKENDQ